MRLEAEGVDNGQGYLFARPLEVEAEDRLLAQAAKDVEVVHAG